MKGGKAASDAPYTATDPPIQILALAEDVDELCRPCVDCGQITGRFCDYCFAEDRIPDERWAAGQSTPLCSKCDNTHDCCHFCRGVNWARPPAWR